VGEVVVVGRDWFRVAKGPASALAFRIFWGEGSMGAKIKLTDAELVVVLERAAANLEAGGAKKGARSVRQATKILRKEEAERAERKRSSEAGGG